MCSLQTIQQSLTPFLSTLYSPSSITQLHHLETSNSPKMAQTIKLASGREMPLVGFGLWKVPKATAAETVYNVRLSSYP